MNLSSKVSIDMPEIIDARICGYSFDAIILLDLIALLMHYAQRT